MALKPKRIQTLPNASVFNYLKKDFKAIIRAHQEKATAERNLFLAEKEFTQKEEEMYKKIADLLLEFVSNDSVNPAAAQFLLTPVQELSGTPGSLIHSVEKYFIDHLVRRSFRFSSIGVTVSRSNNIYMKIGVARANGLPEHIVKDLAIKSINEEWSGLGALSVVEDQDFDAYKITFLPVVNPDFIVQFLK